MPEIIPKGGSSSSTRPNTNKLCYKCRKRGHLSHDCPTKPQLLTQGGVCVENEKDDTRDDPNCDDTASEYFKGYPQEYDF